MTGPVSPDFEVIPRGARQHDDRGRIDPALLERAREIDEALDALVKQARAVIALSPAGGRAVAPLALISAIEKLEGRVNLYEQAVARLVERAR